MNRNASKTAATLGGNQGIGEPVDGHFAAILANLAMLAKKFDELLAAHQEDGDGQPLTQAQWQSLRLNLAVIGATADRAAQAAGCEPVKGGFSAWLERVTFCEYEIEQLAAKMRQEVRP